MHVLVAYDISDSKTRGKVFAWLQDRGVHSQKSVFECEMGASGLRLLKSFMRGLELGETDSIVIYQLCRRCAAQCAVLGRGSVLVPKAWLVI